MTTSHEWLVLGIRLFGLWLVTRGVNYFAAFAEMKLWPEELRSGHEANRYLLFAAIDFAVAAYFLFGARHLGRICEGSQNPDQGEAEEDGNSPPAE